MKRSFHDDSPVSCPKCGGMARKLFSSVPIIFKGSGFYVTDHRGGQNYTSSATPSEDSKPGTPAVEPAKRETKTDKPAAKVAGTK